MNIKIEDLHGQGGKWLKITDENGVVLGEIMNVTASLNRIIGWTFKKFDDGPCKMRKTYHTGNEALEALIKAYQKKESK